MTTPASVPVPAAVPAGAGTGGDGTPRLRPRPRSRFHPRLAGVAPELAGWDDLSGETQTAPAVVTPRSPADRSLGIGRRGSSGSSADGVGAQPRAGGRPAADPRGGVARTGHGDTADDVGSRLEEGDAAGDVPAVRTARRATQDPFGTREAGTGSRPAPSEPGSPGSPEGDPRQPVTPDSGDAQQARPRHAGESGPHDGPATSTAALAVNALVTAPDAARSSPTDPDGNHPDHGLDRITGPDEGSDPAQPTVGLLRPRPVRHRAHAVPGRSGAGDATGAGTAGEREVTVQVSIGRIEVRVTPEAPTRPRHGGATPPPIRPGLVTIEEYRAGRGVPR